MFGQIGAQLSAMMFLQFFVWGAWYVTVGNYMSKIGMTESIYWAYTVGPIAAIISPFFLGLISDKYFPTEKVLGVLHIIGGALIFFSPAIAESIMKDPQAAVASGAFINSYHLPFIAILFIHMLCYMPTLGLTNTLAFHNMTNQEKQFPIIRVFGTIGWIVAGIIVSKILKADESPLPLQIAGGAGIAMGVYSMFLLPNTPPPAKGKKVEIAEIIGLHALEKLSSMSFWVFMISSILICIPLSAYYAYAPVFANAAGLENPGFKMSFGQMSEVFFMFVMPLFFVRLGVKWMLFVGMLAWVIRYVLFALGAEDGTTWMIIGGILLHGICYDFFFVTGQIYVDKKSSPEIRGQAQSILVLLTLGVGMLVGAIIAGILFNNIVTGEGAEALTQWKQFWFYPAGMAAVIMVLFAIFFKDDTKRDQALTDGDVAQADANEPMV